MKLREWICDGLYISGKQAVVLTSENAGHDVAWRKLQFLLGPKGEIDWGFTVRLRRGGIRTVAE